MSFYIRKGFNFGPLRLNLSRSGLGMSVGVKGARVGVGPRGSYVHLGRGGLYYRQSLGHGPSPTPIQPSPQFDSGPVLTEVQSAAAESLVDASAPNVLAELNRVQRRTQILPIVVLVGSPVLVLVMSISSVWIAFTTALVFLVAAVFARHEDVTSGTAVLNYFLDSEPQHDFEILLKAFERLTSCEAVWHVDASGHTDDWKYHAGAETILKRSRVQPCLSKPRRVVSNLDVPMLEGARQKLFFFPDRLLIYDSGGVGAVSYSRLAATATQSRFIEDGRAPDDANVVAHTWQYVNKNGGPDRRFANNPQRDVALYSELVLASESGLRQVFQFSKQTAAESFTAALALLRTSKAQTQ